MSGQNPHDTELMLALIEAEKVDPWHDGGEVRKAIDDIKARLGELGHLEDAQ